MNLGKYTKAIAAGVAAGFAMYQVAGAAGSPAGASITGVEWRDIVVTIVATGLLVWAVPNDPPRVR